MSKIVTVFVLVYVIGLAIFLSNVQNAITISVNNKNHFGQGESFTRGESSSMVLGDGYRHLLIFLQISDMHLSIFHDPTRISAFREFCNITVNTINPAVVIASGDLTDGKYSDGHRTNEFQEEWIHYRQALEENNVLNKTMWLDMRGNHDNFNVHTNSSGFYSKYAIQQAELHNSSSYIRTIVPHSERESSNPSEKYSFIGLDSALKPGPKAPWNFYGKVDTEEYSRLEEFSAKSRESNGSIWFGHYPTSFILTPSGENIRDLMNHASAYLCGHLHTAYGLIDHMYTVQHNGLLELELADFKTTRRFRVAAFDHGVFSFEDVQHHVWPVLLVTNPKSLLFNNPKDLLSARKSTHIRILAFSPSPIQSVMVKVDDGNWSPARIVEDGPLFVLEWNPAKYLEGTHEMTVIAWDEGGSKVSKTLYFAFDDSSMSFSFLGRLALMINAVSLPYSLYLIASISSALPFIWLRFLHKLVKNHHLSLRRLTKGLGEWGTTILRIFWVTATVNKLFFPFVFMPLYFPLGPWSFDQMLDGSRGVAFAWGTFVEGTFLPAAFSYVFDGCIQLFWFHCPFVIVLCVCVDKRFRMICWKDENLSPFWNNVPLIILVVTKLILASIVYVLTGQQLLFLGYLRNYSIIYGSVLWFFSAKLKRRHFLEAESVWVPPIVRGTSTVQQRFVPVGAGDQGTDSDGHES